MSFKKFYNRCLIQGDSSYKLWYNNQREQLDFLVQYALGIKDCAVFLHVNRDRFIFDSDMH